MENKSLLALPMDPLPPPLVVEIAAFTVPTYFQPGGDICLGML